VPDSRERTLGSLLTRLDDTGPDDGLLARFAVDRDEKAFAALLHRYGPVVLGTARRVLGNQQDAEDVAQATFLVLACKARSLRRNGAIGGWLHGVAVRLALRARSDRMKRQVKERSAPPSRPPTAPDDLTWRDLRLVLDEELARLPEPIRTPLVLCYLDGQTQDEAARRLGWTTRTVKARLATGREVLHCRLTRRGLTLSAALDGPLLTTNAIGCDWLSSLPDVASRMAAREPFGGRVSETVINLTHQGGFGTCEFHSFPPWRPRRS
jgi:RNA polymerase sigma factor (sigma-70 family)